MKLDLIENNGPDNLRDALKSECRRASDVSIAVAFVSKSGLDEILQSLRQVAVGGQVRLLTGLYQKVTEPQALRVLLRVQTETRGRFSVRLSKERLFHRKVYLLKGVRNLISIVGSSNLTREGLRSGGELSLIARMAKGDMAAKKITRSFEDEWEHRAVPLTADQIDGYEQSRPDAPNWKSYGKGELARILGAPLDHREADNVPDSTDWWRDCVNGKVKKKTLQVISETTNWDDEGYWWYATGTDTKYKEGNHLLLFDFIDKRIRLVKVKTKAPTHDPTPDGRYFVAYVPIPRQVRCFSKKFWAALAAEGIDRAMAQDRRKLSSATAERLQRILRSKT